VTNARVTRESRQQKAAALRAQTARPQAGRRVRLISTAVVAVIVVVIAIFVFVRNAHRNTAAASGRAGDVKVQYRPIAFLDRNSTANYSTRFLNAMAVLVNSTRSAFPAFRKALFEQQPKEGPRLSDQKPIDLAVAVGAPRPAMATAVKQAVDALAAAQK
jgi:hypothetical protein